MQEGQGEIVGRRLELTGRGPVHHKTAGRVDPRWRIFQAPSSSQILLDRFIFPCLSSVCHASVLKPFDPLGR